MARTAVATDDFNRAGPTLGANWSQRNSFYGDIYIDSSTRFRAGATGQEEVAAWIGAGTINDDQYASVKIAGGIPYIAIGYAIGVACRISADTDGARDYYCLLVNADGGGPNYTTELFKIVNGSKTTLHSAAAAWADGDLIELECEGTTIRACKNGTPLGGLFTVTDSSLATGAVGVAANGGSFYGDDFEGGNLGIAAPASEESNLASRRNRPGRGPYSLGRYFRQRIDAFTSLIGSVFSDSISETASASDSVSSTVAYSATIAESASAADSFAATLAAVAAVAESGSLADSINAALAATASISETGDAQFTPTTGAAISAAIVETATAADSVASVLAAVAALSESGAASDSVSAIASLVAALSESMTATDSVSWGGAVYSVDIAEAANATNTLTAAVSALAALAETGNATDTVSALASLQAALAEAGTALDTLTVTGIYGVSVNETGDITFTVSVDSGILPGTPSRSVTVRAANRTITVRAANRTVTVH